MIHANIHASIWQLFLVFYCVHETLELVLVQSCKHLSRNETKNSFWSGGNLPRQNCGESMDFERKSSQMRGEGLGGICVVCAYGPWAQSAHVDVMFIRWRLCLLGGWHRVCWMQWDACVGAIASRICIGLLCCFVFGVVVVFCCCMVTNLSQKRHNVIGKRCSTSRPVVSCSTNSSSKKLCIWVGY